MVYKDFIKKFIKENLCMSVQTQTLSLSIKGIECEDIEYKSNEITCEVLKNSQKVSIATLDEHSNIPSKITNLALNDHIQLILKDKLTQSLIGCISFTFGTFVKQNCVKISQW